MTEQLNNRVNKCQLARQKYKVSGAGEESFAFTICLIFASSSSCVAHRKKIKMKMLRYLCEHIRIMRAAAKGTITK